MQRKELQIFSGNANRQLARAIAGHLGVPLGNCDVKRFPDGEIDLKVTDDVRGADVFIVQSTCPPVNEHLMELLLMIDTMRRASAQRITAVLPYFGYARKDRKDEGRVPISAKLVANLITTAGADRVLTIDLHASQIQGFFDIPVDHLYAKPVFLEHFRKMAEGNDLAVVAPDVGSVKMARAYADELKAGLAIVTKRRISPTETETGHVIGEVKDKRVIIIDDMISTAGSICEAARAVIGKGASSVILAATHAVFCGPALERIHSAEIEKLVVTDTIPHVMEPGSRIHVLSIGQLLARAVQRIHRSESVSILFKSFNP